MSESDSKTSLSLLNPYTLLGLTPESSLIKAKRTYYNFALMCHPDKGGSADDMIIITKAYEYVKKQLNVVYSKKDVTYEGLEEEFEAFCRDQESKPPPFSQIYEETSDWIKEFNKEFVEQKKFEDYNPFSLGYGDLMDKSIISNNNESNNNDSNNNDSNNNDSNNNDSNKYQDKKYLDKEETKVGHNFCQVIAEYKEPQCLPDTHQEYPLNTKKIDDFTSINNKKNIILTDYKKAFSPKVELEELQYNDKINGDINKKYEDELKQRGY